MIFLLCCIGSIALVNGQEQSPSRRIVDGYVAEPYQFPYAARLYYGKLPECTATIIHERWVLTAGHCIHLNRRDPKVLVGSVDTQTDRNGVYYNAERLIQHEEYLYVPGKINNIQEVVINDIGLVRLKKPIVFSANVQPIRVPRSVNKYADVIGTIVGFGLRKSLYEEGAANSQLRYAPARLISFQKCRAFYPYIADYKHICTENIGTNVPSAGDSGGPLVVQGNEIGIISTVADENISNPYAGPSLYTKVDGFEPWISQHMSVYGEQLPL